jgi:DNA replication and repair protein RecF
MAFLSLRTAGFRNLEDNEVITASKDIFLIGQNGQGKTNFLEALYFCSYASSFRGTKDRDLVCNGMSDFSVSGELGSLPVGSLPESSDIFLSDVFNSHLTVKFEKKVKSINLNGKKIEDRKDILETAPCVAFCHEDMEFVYGSQERRRWFFDQSQSLYDSVYLDDLRKYRRVLKTRNTVLREAKISGNFRQAEEILDALNPQLIEYGERLMEKRTAAAERFSAVFSPLYQEVSGIAGITVSYVPSWKKESRLVECKSTDFAQGTTVSGPHRDRYLFARGDPSKNTTERSEFSETASTGQRRLLALLLRVAQALCFSGLSGKMPVLLLDDVLLELDGEKRCRFLSVMPGYEQAFFTFLPEEPYKNYCKSDTLVYHVNSGCIRKKP